jgi:glycerol transport system ATP-binding protein
MAEIRLQNLAHSYTSTPSGPEDYAIRQMDHIWEQGGAYALLGPSGCGKSTLLNIISGLLSPSQGHVLFDGKAVNNLTPEKRNIAQVFQFPVVYDTMTVFDNLAFPLRNQGMAEAKIHTKVQEIAEVLDLQSLLSKKASNLTADEKQKVSMGRGLVRDDVSAILFDEPLTVIDPHLKWKLRRKLKQIHEQFNIATGIVRTAEPHLCRLFHRQSGDEPDRGAAATRWCRFRFDPFATVRSHAEAHRRSNLENPEGRHSP